MQKIPPDILSGFSEGIYVVVRYYLLLDSRLEQALPALLLEEDSLLDLALLLVFELLELLELFVLQDILFLLNIY